MSSIEFIDKMKNIQKSLLDYIDDEDDSEDKFQAIKDILTKIKNEDNQYELKSFLNLLLKISKNYHRTANFFCKIDRILDYLKDDLQKYFTNPELFHFFSSSRRILSFLVDTKIMVIDKYIIKRIIRNKYLESKYPQYFQPEIQPFINEEWFPKYKHESSDGWILEIEKEIPEDFRERRKIGENDHFICELIRKDSFEDFIVYVNQNNFQSNSTISPSIHESNNFLLKNKNTTIIEYAAFFGSIQIFNYLRNKGVELTPSLWHYAIHGRNAEIIQILEENQIKPEDESYKQIFKESIKCHHNDVANYIKDNYLVNENEEEESNYEFLNGLKYHNFNFNFIKNEKINETTFNYLCEYDYYTLVSILLKTMNIDINHKTIYKIIHFKFNF